MYVVFALLTAHYAISANQGIFRKKHVRKRTLPVKHLNVLHKVMFYNLNVLIKALVLLLHSSLNIIHG